jgi:hypothetical protein
VILKGIQIGVATSLFNSPIAGNTDVLGWNLVTTPVDAVPETEYRRACGIGHYRDIQDRWIDHEAVRKPYTEFSGSQGKMIVKLAARRLPYGCLCGSMGGSI